MLDLYLEARREFWQEFWAVVDRQVREIFVLAEGTVLLVEELARPRSAEIFAAKIREDILRSIW